MKNFLKSTVLSLAVLCLCACDDDKSYEDPGLEVTPHNIAGTWQLAEWNGAPLAEGSFVYIEFTRKDKLFTMYQNLDSFGTRKLTGRYDITTDVEPGGDHHGTVRLRHGRLGAPVHRVGPRRRHNDLDGTGRSVGHLDLRTLRLDSRRDHRRDRRGAGHGTGRGVIPGSPGGFTEKHSPEGGSRLRGPEASGGTSRQSHPGRGRPQPDDLYIYRERGSFSVQSANIAPEKVLRERRERDTFAGNEPEPCAFTSIPLPEALRVFAEGLPGSFDRSGETLHEGRNTIKAFEADGNKLAVKRFQRPDPLRAVIYTFFRRSKGAPLLRTRRAAACPGHRLPGTGRLERIPPPRPAVRQLLRLPPFRLRPALAGHDPVPGSRHASRAGGLRPLRSRACTRKGIEHEDFNHGNILWQRDPATDRFRFQLIDINRMRFFGAGIASAPVHDKPATPGLPGRGVPLHPGPLRRGARLEQGRHPPAGHFLPARVRPSPRIAQTLPAADLGPPERKNTPKIWIPGIIRYICPSIKRSGRCVHTALHIISITFSFIAREKAGPYAFDPTRRKA